MQPFNQAWTLFKEYYPDDISDDDYEEAEYAQNPQWPHKNWMSSPQWPQLCDFVLEGVDDNGCGRVIDGERLTGVPMMSGHAMCHDCLRELAGPPPTMTLQGTPNLQDDSWQDSIERGEPMNLFDQAWALLKALPEQQLIQRDAGDPDAYMSMGTIHPQIASMIRRLLRERDMQGPFYEGPLPPQGQVQRMRRPELDEPHGYYPPLRGGY